MKAEALRISFCACLFGFLTACATQPSVQPIEYLDEHTAATITKVAHPWVFNREGAPAQLDFVHLYALDINRMGTHQLYLVVLKHWDAPDLPSDRPPALEIQSSSAPALRVDALDASARELGVGQALDSTAPKGAKSWFYPIEVTQLAAISSGSDARVALVMGEARASYIEWHDAHAAFSEFAAAMR